jgi:hypothetical protein
MKRWVKVRVIGRGGRKRHSIFETHSETPFDWHSSLREK